MRTIRDKIGPLPRQQRGLHRRTTVEPRMLTLTWLVSRPPAFYTYGIALQMHTAIREELL